MQLYLDEMLRVYDDILTFFGDDNRDENARREFFGKLAGFVQEYKRSHEKNLVLEETWKRNEANMRRKQAAAAAALPGGPSSPSADAPGSPGQGAMDTLLEKLRAAAPQARATREQRRRARLKDKHQVRVASGQKIPETGENVDENGLTSPGHADGSLPSEEGGEKEGAGAASEGEDIADRAASLLQGLRGDGEGSVSEMPGRDESLRVRRRRESADDERARRRERRRRAGASSADTPAQNSAIPEESEAAVTVPEIVLEGDEGRERGSGEKSPPVPETVVVPPSPTASETRFAGGE